MRNAIFSICGRPSTVVGPRWALAGYQLPVDDADAGADADADDADRLRLWTP